MPLEADVKSLPVLACLVAGIALGRLWFSKWAFGPAWLADLGKTEAEMNANVRVRAYVTVILANTASYVLLAVFIASTGTATILGGLLVGALCGTAFIAAMNFVDDAFLNRSVRYSLLTGSFRILQMSVAGTILGGWQNAPF